MAAIALPVIWTLVRRRSDQTVDSTEVSMSRQWDLMIDESLCLAAQSAWTMVVAIPLCYGASLIALRAIHGDRARPFVMLCAYCRPISFAVLISVFTLLALVPTLLWMLVAIVLGAFVGIATMSRDGTPERAAAVVTVVAVISGLPFLLTSLYIQGRVLLAGLTLLDKSVERVGVGAALVQSWQMTKRQNAALSHVAAVAVWELLRGLTVGLLIGFVTRGMPMFFALVAASYARLTLPRIKA